MAEAPRAQSLAKRPALPAIRQRVSRRLEGSHLQRALQAVVLHATEGYWRSGSHVYLLERCLGLDVKEAVWRKVGRQVIRLNPVPYEEGSEIFTPPWLQAKTGEAATENVSLAAFAMKP